VNCERITFRRRIARGIYRGISVKNDYANAHLGRGEGKGSEFIGKKYYIRAARRKIEKETESTSR